MSLLVHLPLRDSLIDVVSGTEWTSVDGGGGTPQPNQLIDRVPCTSFLRCGLHHPTSSFPSIAITTPFTFSVWFYPLDMRNQVLLMKYSWGSPTNNNFYIYLWSTGLVHVCSVGQIAEAVWELNTWQHLEISGDGANLYTYLNGKKVLDKPIADVLGSNALSVGYPFGIGVGGGRSDYISTYSFNGYMCNFRYYDECLHTSDFRPTGLGRKINVLYLADDSVYGYKEDT